MILDADAFGAIMRAMEREEIARRWYHEFHEVANLADRAAHTNETLNALTTAWALRLRAISQWERGWSEATWLDLLFYEEMLDDITGIQLGSRAQPV